jgi:Na+/phosphate symporter
MVLLLVTRAREFAIKRNHEQFHESLKLGAVIFDMLHLLRRVAVHYLTMCEKNYAD